MALEAVRARIVEYIRTHLDHHDQLRSDLTETQLTQCAGISDKIERFRKAMNSCERWMLRVGVALLPASVFISDGPTRSSPQKLEHLKLPN